jgi:hypothetical protein
MFRGFVDAASHTRVAGWAVDTARPDERVELSVVVNGYERERFRAERLREDLRALGGYGDGRHGFIHAFEPPLENDRRYEILVRFATTKETLERGRIVISKEGVQSTNGLPVIEPAPEQETTLLRLTRAPHSVRQLIEIMQLFDNRRKLEAIVGRLDFTGVNQRQIYRAVLDRLPSPEEVALEATDGSIEELFQLALTSDEFQKRIISLALSAFPEKRRMIFVHVPKCAGTDLIESLSPYYPHLYYLLSLEQFTTKELLFSSLKEISLRLRLADFVFVSGHVPLGWYLDNDLIRHGDRIFTTIREPMQIAISNANFVATRLIMFRHESRPDTAGWLQALGLQSIPEEPTVEYSVELAKKILYTPSLTTKNVMCNFLGRGTFDNTISQLRIADIEITDTTRYGRWRKRTWGLEDTTRANESSKNLTNENLSDVDKDYIRSITVEDQRLYDLLMSRLNRSASLSIRGSQL